MNIREQLQKPRVDFDQDTLIERQRSQEQSILEESDHEQFLDDREVVICENCVSLSEALKLILSVLDHRYIVSSDILLEKFSILVA